MQVENSPPVVYQTSGISRPIGRVAKMLYPFRCVLDGIKNLINNLFYNFSFSCSPKKINNKVSIEESKRVNQSTTQKATEVLNTANSKEVVVIPNTVATLQSAPIPAEISSCMERALDPTTKEFKVMAHLRELGIGPNEKTSLDETVYRASLMADFIERDKMSQTNTPKKSWGSKGRWGPAARLYLKPTIPQGVDPIQWKRDRVIAVSLWFEGLKYQNNETLIDGKPARGHFPDRGNGLDCSNFTAWVYNYGLGIRFSEGVNDLIAMNSRAKNAGRKLNPNEPLQRGDLLLYKGNINHVVIYVNENLIIDSTRHKPGVGLRDIIIDQGGRYQMQNIHNYLFALRPVE
ncbi:MAG: C40 family peptidase [Silvanigrellaceae bacterium]|nr:C40 family peptidase [Silvanigrellaceae bacterium]